jgi:hypothetical protein
MCHIYVARCFGVSDRAEGKEVLMLYFMYAYAIFVL